MPLIVTLSKVHLPPFSYVKNRNDLTSLAGFKKLMKLWI